VKRTEREKERNAERERGEKRREREKEIQIQGEREKQGAGGSSPLLNLAQGAGSPLAGWSRRPPADRRRPPELGWPVATPGKKQGGGSSPLPPTTTARACCPGRAQLWPHPCGQRAEGGSPGARRPSVAGAGQQGWPAATPKKSKGGGYCPLHTRAQGARRPPGRAQGRRRDAGGGSPTPGRRRRKGDGGKVEAGWGRRLRKWGRRRRVKRRKERKEKGKKKKREGERVIEIGDGRGM